MTTDKSMFAYFKEGTAHLPRTNRTVSFYGRELTLGEVMAEIDGFAARLTEIGVGKGDNVIICLGNIPDAVIAFYAVNKIGAIANLVHPLVTASRLVQIARTMHSKAAVLFDEFYGGYDGWEELGVKTFIASAADYLPRVLAPFYRLAKKRTTSPSRGQESFLSAVKRGMGLQGGATEAEIGGEDIAIYMHSGGTTGTPKSVELSNRAFNALAHNLLALIGGKPVDDRDAMLMVLPLFHNFGLGVCMHTSLSAGGKLTLTVSVTNTGKRAGKETVQLYIGDEKASAERPHKELKDFAKVELQPGETKTVSFDITTEALQFWSDKTHSWTAEPGRFKAYVCASETDVRGTAEFTLQ